MTDTANAVVNATLGVIVELAKTKTKTKSKSKSSSSSWGCGGGNTIFLSKGATAGIVVGAFIAGFLLALALQWFFVLHHRPKAKKSAGLQYI
jgi:hypothetical protein